MNRYEIIKNQNSEKTLPEIPLYISQDIKDDLSIMEKENNTPTIKEARYLGNTLRYF